MAANRAWSDLPEELLSIIASFVSSNPLHFSAFRSVCRSWRLSSSSSSSSSLLPAFPHHPILSPPLPLDVLIPFNYPLGIYSFDYCVLSVTFVYALRPPVEHPLFYPNVWLCFVNQSEPTKLRIRNPLFSPFLSRLENLPTTINLVDLCASELGRFYSLTSLNLSFTPIRGHHALKVVLSSKMSAVISICSAGRLGFLRLAVGERWEIIHDGMKSRFDDIIEFKGTMLGVDRRSGLYEIGLDKPFTINAIVDPIGGGRGRRKRLVESTGELFLVVRCSGLDKKSKKPVAALFKAYKLVANVKKTKKKWGEVTKFDDRVFIFDIGFSFSASIQQLFGGVCGRNCILYKEMSFSVYRGTDDDEVMFSQLEWNDFNVGVWHLEDAARIHTIESYPSFWKLLWPPPTWAFSIDKFQHPETAAALNGNMSMMDHDGFKLTGFSPEVRSYRTQRFVDESQIIANKSIEIVEQNKKVSEENHTHILEMQKLLAEIQQSCLSDESSSPASSVKSDDSEDPFDGAFS